MYLQQQYGFIHLDPQMYYLNEVPVEFSFTGLLLINIGVAVSAWAVLTLPAIAAARIDPAQSARYE
ncbi:MAG: ABC transporter permease, partial [Muribaculaceae bacterium]|nr:ABC transporter permease [Muribaculaceae bacterium]